MARLRIPRLGVDAIVLEGVGGAVLAFGPGHVPTSALPESVGNCILAGHRDTSFKFMAEIRPGDLVLLETRDAAAQKPTASHQPQWLDTTVCFSTTPPAVG